MARIRGRYINLDGANQRRTLLEKHLNDLGWSGRYRRFPAKTSTSEEAEARGLSKAELGLWKSWEKLLLEELRNIESDNFDYLHILEDDAILSPMIESLAKELGTDNRNLDLIFTEMYVNAEIYMFVNDEISQLRDAGKVILNREFYTGCASSVLIPRSRIHHVHEVLKTKISAKNQLLPIDNAFRSFKEQEQLKIACTFPFLSSIRVSEIRNSSIQEREGNAIEATQELNALLRQDLSTIKDRKIEEEIVLKIVHLAQLHGVAKCKKTLRKMLEAAQSENLMRYKQDQRLANEKDNPQIQAK